MQQKISKQLKTVIKTFVFIFLVYLIVSIRMRLIEARQLIASTYINTRIGELLVENDDYEKAICFFREAERNIVQYAVRCDIKHSMLRFVIEPPDSRTNMRHRLMLNEKDYQELCKYLDDFEKDYANYFINKDNSLFDKFNKYNRNWDGVYLTSDENIKICQSPTLYCNILISSVSSDEYNYSIDLLKEPQMYRWSDFTNQVAISKMFSSNVVYNVLLHCSDDINIDAITPLADLLLNKYNQKSFVLFNRYRCFELPPWKSKQYKEYYDEM